MNSSDLQAIKQRYNIVGNCDALNHVLDVALQVAPTDLSVLIIGESGVGKEIIPRVIHDSSPRRRETFRNRLAEMLPGFFGRVADKVSADPHLLEGFVSGSLVTRLASIDIAGDAFWDMVGERIMPGMRETIASALAEIPPEQFAGIFAASHHIAAIVERTVAEMELLDFYAMLDEVMAEHLGAIQVFGFFLGAAVGYLQYAALSVAPVRPVAAYLMLGLPAAAAAAAKFSRAACHIRRRDASIKA